ncbi:MAG TPA: permease-like cell division protein FtsX [Burkholderiaceae bacterium]|jgi:cell division transport system permease protein|nr:permease-like cell division protein FtsX [Burkholderiaceae bacterium]
MITWIRQHAFALSRALRQMFKPRSGFLLNMIVVAIALALPFAGLTLLENMRPLSRQLAVEPEISIFMKMDTSREKALATAADIHKIVDDSKAQLEFVPREKALASLNEKSGMADVVATLGANPLPDGYVLKLAGLQNSAEATRVDSIAAQLKTLPDVETVQVDSTWVKRLAALLHILQVALLFLALTLGVVVVAVVFNTIRLQVMTQREEIEVSRVVGATDSFICRPFYYSGALLGLCAGAAALGVVALALQPLNDAIADFARLYASEFRLAPLGISATAILLGLSAALGLAGALMSVQRHLSRIR